MQTNKIKIGIDLDLTIFDTDKGWVEWLHRNSTDHDLSRYMEDLLNDNVDYNLANYFTMKDDVDSFSYWSEESTYADCNIFPHAKRFIQDLYEANCEIIFISYCMGCKDQIGHKIDRLKKEFDFLLPDDFNFVATKKKGTVRCDVLIDDRNTFLNQQPENVKIIKYYSPYSQEETLDREHTLCKDWYQVEDEVVKFLEEFDYNE